VTLLLPDVGEGLWLQYVVNKATPQDLRLRLFQSNTTPAETDVAGTYTESSFTGYANISLTGANWTITAGAPSHADYAQQSFTSSANQTAQQVYGYYLTRVTGGELMWAERFPDGPYPVSNNGDVIKVTPYIEQA
jgi:hypothetical protein